MTTSPITAIFTQLGIQQLFAAQGLAVTSPLDGATLATLAQDTPGTLSEKITGARKAQAAWAGLTRAQRAQLLETFAATLRANRETLAELIHLEAGKTKKEALGEVDGAADNIPKAIKDAALPEFGGMLRRKERTSAGAVGLITSFNFPIIVAYWTLSPALLAGNAVVWKPSEKTPLVALACKALWNKVMGAHGDLLQIAIGGRDVGQALVASEQIDVISATGSVAMGQGIKATLAKKTNNALPPILELGGNNGVIISNKISPSHLEFAVQSLFTSFLGTCGQRCTNTRRLIVHKSQLDKTVAHFKTLIEKFIASGIGDPANDYGYGPLIDADAFKRFENAKTQVTQAGGQVLFGKRLWADKFPNAYFVEPVLAVLPSPLPITHEETFAPLLYIIPYDNFDQAIELLNAPANAGLVAGIYTQSQKEADSFAAQNQAGHSVINSPKGTGTPAFGMGFGGNKESGTGEILNAADPLQPFTRPGKFTRVAQNKDVVMDAD
jgi:aldehyde dehydrogenase (NAD+)